MTPVVKICGLSTALTLDAALEAGADMVGFVFFPKSPRHIDFATARALGRRVEGRAKIVALSVDADDETLKRIVDALSPDLMQLHGAETPERVKRIGELCALPTMKAIGVAARADLAQAKAYEGVADYPPDRRQAAQGRGAARRQRPSVRLAPDAGVSFPRSVALVRRARPRECRDGDRAQRSARRRYLLRRRERARRQG